MTNQTSREAWHIEKRTDIESGTHYYATYKGRKFSVVDIATMMFEAPIPDELKSELEQLWGWEAMEVVDEELTTDNPIRSKTKDGLRRAIIEHCDDN